MTHHLKFDIKLPHEASDEEEEVACQAMKAIVYSVDNILAAALSDERTHFKTVHPRQLTAIIVNNILLHLFMSIVPVDINPLETRLKMARSLLDDIDTIFMDCVEKIEMVRSRPEGGKH